MDAATQVRTPLAAEALVVTYRAESPTADFEKIATEIAVGQTLGTANPETLSALSEYLARVVSVHPVEMPADSRHALIEIAYPLPTVQSDIGTLLTVIFGKISMAGRLRVVDIRVPNGLQSERMAGPAFGISGIRQLTGVTDPSHPLLMCIFKPCLGLAPAQLGDLFYAVASRGVELMKDDEILSDHALDSARRRLEAVLKASVRVAAETGRKTLYAINLTGPAHELLDRAKVLAEEGANLFLFNYLSYGLPMLASLRQANLGVPLMAHPALAGSFYGSPAHGISPRVLFGALPRLAGADLVLYPSPYGSVALDKNDALGVCDALRQNMHGVLPAFPVPSAGIKPEMCGQILEDFGPQVVINAGTGIHDYPGGPPAGVPAFRQEIHQRVAGYPLQSQRVSPTSC